MDLIDEINKFLRAPKIDESAVLRFIGVDGYDVYNPSVPFRANGNRYLFGRVERRADWATSRTVLFSEKEKDVWEAVPTETVYPLEDPFVCRIRGELILGGTHVRYCTGSIQTYYCYFYRGQDPAKLKYYTTGPNYMKDIRLVDMRERGIGVFSRPRSQKVLEKYGSESVVGFRMIRSISELTDRAISRAKPMPELFGKGEWGGCNQAFLLDSGLIGCIGHQCYAKTPDEPVYVVISFVMDPETRHIVDRRVIATRSCFPAGESKLPTLADVAFPAGIVRSEREGCVELYSGLGDCLCGRAVIRDPFEGFGKILWDDEFPVFQNDYDVRLLAMGE